MQHINVTCIVFFVLLSLFAHASVPYKAEGQVRLYQRLTRSRRQAECHHGTYDYEDRKCCLCGAGARVKEHCTATSQTKCEVCEGGSYSTLPNFQPFCEPCTSCSQLNANLEVAEACTIASDAKCRCKKDHYCIRSKEDTCKLCNPCKECGDSGIKVPCTAVNNTVCNDSVQGGNLSVIVGVSISILIVAIGVLVGFLLWKKKRSAERNITGQQNGNVTQMEMQRLKATPVDLTRYVHDIANVITWRDMEAIATRTGLTTPAIENCKQKYPGEPTEQTVELLKIWAEQQGMQASEKLVQMLQDKDKRGTAEKVVNILCSDSSVPKATTE